MPHERRELLQPAGGIEPLPIPAQQAADREAVAQAVQPRRRNTVGHRQLKRADELAEGLAGGASANAARTVEGKQRLGIDDRPIAVSTLQLLLKQRGDPRSVRNETALAELAGADHQQVTLGVDVAQAQSARFPDAQP